MAVDSKQLQLCKIVGFDPSGKLLFHCENLNILLENVRKSYDKETPVSILAVTGPPKCGKTFYTNLIIQNLRENGSRSWFKKLLKGQPLPGFPFGEPSVGADYLPDADFQKDGIYVYPNPIFLDDTRNEQPLWMLDLVLKDDEHYKTRLEAMLVTLLLFCSQLIEIQMKDEKSVLDPILDKMKRTSFNSDFICPSIIHLKRGSSTEESRKEINYNKSRRCIPNFKESLHDESGNLNSTLSIDMWDTIIQPVKDILLEEHLTPKLNGYETLTIIKIGEYFKMCVDMVNEHILGTPGHKAPAPAIAPKLKNIEPENTVESTASGESNGESMFESFSFTHCKIAERKPNGELCLLRENLESILTTIHTKSPLPVLLLSLIGPPSSGKSTITNLILAYLQQKGAGGWITKFSKENYPLFGFSYGHGDNLVTKNCIVADDVSSGIYLCPQGFTLSKEAQFQICVMDVNYTARDEWKNPLDSLQALLTLSCDMVVELKKSDNTGGPIEAMGKIVAPNQLPKMIRYFLQAGTKDASKKILRELKSHLKFPNDIEYQYIYRTDQPLHNESGQLRLGRSHITTLNNSMENIFEEGQFSKITTKIKSAEEIVKFLYHQVTLLNESPTFNLSIEKEKQHDEETQIDVSDNTDNLLIPVQNTENSSTPKTDDNVSNTSEKKGTDSRKFQSAEEGDSEIHMIKKLVEQMNTSKLLKTTECEMEIWIDQKMTLTNFTKFEEIFKDTLNTELLQQMKNNSISKDKKITLNVAAEVSNMITKSNITHQVHQIQLKLVALHTELYAAFTEQICLHLSEIPTFVKRAIQQLRKHTAQESSENKAIVENLFIRACQKLADIYENHNNKIRHDESKLFSKSAKQIQTSFKECLEWVQEQGLRPPYIVNAVVHKVEENHLDVFNSILPTTLDNEKLEEVTIKMQSALNNISANFIRKNRLSFEKYRKTVADLISARIENYKLDMDKLVDENPEGIQRQTFEAVEKQYRDSSEAVLKEELKKLNSKEPVECHQMALRKHLEKKLEDYEEENNEKLEYADKKMQMDQTDLNVPKEKDYDHLNTSHEVVDVKGLKSSATLHCQLRPLIVQFSMDMICIAQSITEDGKLQLPYLQSSIPAAIGVTKTYSWVIGPQLEAEHRMKNLRQSWQIGCCLCPQGETLWSERICINEEGDKKQITVEFLLGYFFRIVKDRVEEVYSGKSTTIIIAVPHWLASAQRQRVKDSAMIAGYINCHLINNTYGLAHSLLLNNHASARKQSMAVVISENSGNVDICIYDLIHEKKKLSKTLVHVGDYEIQRHCKRSGTYRDDGMKGWEKMWSDAKQCLTDWKYRQWDYNESNAVFLVSWNSDAFASELSNLLRTINNKAHTLFVGLNDTESLIAFSSCDIYNRNLFERITGCMTYDILAIPFPNPADGKNPSPVLVTKKEHWFKYAHNYLTGASITTGKNLYQFYQFSLNAPVFIGELFVDKQTFFQFQPTFTVSNEDIIILASFNGKKSRALGFYSSSETIDSLDTSWKKSTLDDQSIAIFSSLIELFQDRSKLHYMKAALFQKVEHIKNALDRHPFKSELAKSLALQKLNNIIDKQKAPNCTKDNVIEAEKILALFEEKYCKH